VFGDGGITAIGANCVNIALVMPFVAWYTFKGITKISDSARFMKIGVFVAGYISLNIAALFTAFELGIQPLIASNPDGSPIYSPFPLKVALPALALEHLLLFGIVEGIVTVLIFNYFYANNRNLIVVLKNERV